MVASSSAKTKRTKNGAASTLPLAAGPGSFDRQTFLASLALVLAVLAFYIPVIHNQFIHYDDNEYITENPHVTGGLSWTTVEWAFTTFHDANWHPLTWLSHALDCDLFGLSPVGPHVVNVLLHAANAVLLFLLLQRATGFRWRSLMVAALFALHPVNVESVAWAAERKNVLSMLFFLIALYAYDLYANDRYARKPGTWRYTAVAAFYALALMAKPQVITFPFLLLLWDYWPLRRFSLHGSAFAGSGAANSALSQIGQLVREKIPLFLLSAASAAVTMEAQRAGGAIRSLTRFSFSLRLENVVISYARYLGKAIWPSKLSVMYPHPLKLFPAWQVGGALLVLLLITALVLRARSRTYLAVGWLWFLGTFVPMIGLVQVGEQGMADRYAYIPFIGLFVMAVWLVADWAKAHNVSGLWLAIPASAYVLVLGILTCRQVPYWHDSESMWRLTLERTSGNYIAHGHLAALLHDQGKTEEAISQVRAVLAISPADAVGNMLLGDYEMKQGNVTAAIDHYQVAALNTVTGRARAYANLGFAYSKIGETLKAKQSFETSLELSPNQPVVVVTVGVLDDRLGDPSAAVQQYTRAMAMQPTDVGYLLLAHALQKEGHADEAAAAREHAASISSDLDQAQAQADSLLAGK